MLCLRTCLLEDEIIPVEVTEVEICICSCLVRNHPWTVRMFGNVITTVFHHIDLLVAECPCSITLEILIELVTESHMIVTAGDEIRRSRVGNNADATVVVDLCLARSTVLCVDEHNTCRSLCSVDRTSRCILKDRNRLDIIRIYLRERALHTVNEDKRRT